MRLVLLALLGVAAVYADDVSELAARIEDLASKEAPLPRLDTARRAERLLAATRPDLAARFRKLEGAPQLVDAPTRIAIPALPAGGAALENAVQRLVEKVEHSGDDPASYDALAAIIRKRGLGAGLDNPSIRARIALADLNDLVHPALVSLDGRQIHLSDYRGKPVLLVFWATWCIPCREELARLERLQAYSKDLVVLAVSYEPADTVRKFLREYHYDVPIYLDPGHRLSDHFHVDHIPAAFRVDADGRARRVD